MKNPICSILWQDAAYSFEEYNPKNLPSPTMTVGFIVEANDKSNYTKIATSVHYKNKKIVPVDGMLIPVGSEINFKRIGYYEK